MTQNIIGAPVETIVRTTGTQTIAGDKVFTGDNSFDGVTSIKQFGNPVAEVKLPTSLTANSGTIIAGQLVGGILVFSPTADATWTLPLGTDIDSVFNAPMASRGRSVQLSNNSAFNVIILPNTGTTLGGFVGGALDLPPFSNVIVDLVKLDTTPTYTLFGVPPIYFNQVFFTGTSKTLALSDAYSFQNCGNAAAQTITVPLNSSVAFPIGTTINFAQIGAGQVDFAATGGVTILSKLGNLKISIQYAGATLTKTATDTWLLVGDLSV